MKLYPYVGPANLARLANSSTERYQVENLVATARWVSQHSALTPNAFLTLTFVVLPGGLWVADRRSEHVACARGDDVLSAGEMTFSVDCRQKAVDVVSVTNQSTGYCPEPESWPVVAAELDRAGIGHPGEFTTKITFRRCITCGTTNIVKDDWFRCAVCNAELPSEWNFGTSAARQLVAIDSPEMRYALQLSQEVFPGCRVTPEVMADPDDPSQTWYSLNILWKGDIQEMLPKDMEWHREFEAKFPRAANDFCLNSLPE